MLKTLLGLKADMPTSSAKKVLIVEDHPMLTEILERQLKYLGLKVSIARTGEGALKKAAEQLPELILLDLSMPDMSGLEIVSLIRNNPMTSRIPIIAVSAFGYMRGPSLESGCHDFLAKPFLFLDLVILMKKVLSRTQRNRSST